jgi:hypothetical protein
MSGPPIPYSNPPPVNLVTPSNLGAETALQQSNDHYYFALSSDTSGANLFVGPIVIEGVGAAVQVVDTGGNDAVSITAPAVGQGAVFLNSSGVDAQTNSISIRAGATPGQFSITSIGSIAPGNILNYDQTSPSVQLGNAGGIVEVRGPVGLGQVYDEVNHPVISNTNVVTIASYNGAFTTITDTAYTPATSGYYLVTYALTADGAGISWGTPNGSAVVNTGLTLTQGSLVYINNSEVAYYGIIQGPLTDTKQVLVYLTGGVPVYNDFQNVGTANAGASGGLVVQIQPFA